MCLRKLFTLEGKNAVVTGATQGIGKAIALGLAEFGANVIVHGKDEEKDAAEVTNTITKLGQKSGQVLCDLEKEKTPSVLFQGATQLFNSIDILVLNASIQIRKPWQEMSAADFEKQVAINFRSTMQLIQLFGSGMIERSWGRLIIIGSVQEKKPHPDMLVYAATKAANTNMIKNLALQLSGKGITVNNIAPGVIETPRNETVLSDPGYRSAILEKVPAGYFGVPDDIAGAAIWLCAETGRYVTGQEIYVDGGMSL